MSQRGMDLIIRHKVNDLFAELSHSKAIYVSAPGGYGKTLAVKQWMNKNHRTSAIISLDVCDNNPVLFCERFCMVLRSCQPNNMAFTGIISHPAFACAPDEFTIKAIAALSNKKRSILAVDDLHVINNNEIIKLLLLFLKRLPENIQIIIISRNDLPPGFSELWLKGQLAFVSTDDLLFDRDEIMRLYKKKGSVLAPTQADEIYRFTGGWAIGINALLLSGNRPSEGTLDYLDDFISSNVWKRWDDKTRDFMINTAAANELHPALCEKLTGEPNSEEVLKELIHKGSFIYQTENGVCQYHHLFRDFLQKKLAEKGEKYLQDLLFIEGEWYLSKHDIFNAANCFVRAKNHDGIAKCFSQPEFIDRKDLLISIMGPIIKDPEVLLAAEGDHPFLYYAMSWLAFIEGRIDDAMSYMDSYYSGHSGIIKSIPSFSYNIYFLYLLDIRISFKDLAGKISALPKNPDINVNGIKGLMIVNLFLLHRATIDFSELATDDTPESVSLLLKKQIGRLFGPQAKQIADCITALLLYEQGYPEKAYTYAIAAISGISEIDIPELKLAIMSALVHIMDALGQQKDAGNMIEHIKTIMEQNKLYYLNTDFSAVFTRRQLADGSMDAAKHWLEKYRSSPLNDIGLYNVYLAFTTCRAYIVNGNYDCAILLLQKTLDFAKAYERPLDIIEACILLAIAYWKKKRTFQKNAMIFLENAVSLAYKYGYIQIFVNDGAELLSMLQRLKKRTEQIGEYSGKPSASFVKMLHLRALEHRNSGLTSAHTEPVMKYTDKQKAVMNLLCVGKSYNEIAEEVGVKRTTLRSHIALIYKKLGVTNGIDAVKKIKALNLL